MNRTALFFLALLLLVAGGTALVLGWRYAATPRAGSSNEPLVLPDTPLEEFTLVERSGRTFHSRELDGQLWVASFFFSRCPGSCVQQNELLATLAREYGPRGVKFVSITCDPARDTPEQLAEYARRFRASPDEWLFLTDRSGKIDYIQRVGGDLFQLLVAELFHADTFVLVDRDGKMVEMFGWQNPERVAALRAELERRLTEEPVTEPAEEPAEPPAA